MGTLKKKIRKVRNVNDYDNLNFKKKKTIKKRRKTLNIKDQKTFFQKHLIINRNYGVKFKKIQ